MATATRRIDPSLPDMAIGTDPEGVILAWFPVMQGWVKGALNSADGVRVDADVLLEYETALPNAKHEFLQEA